MRVPNDKIAEYFDYAREGLYSAGNKPQGDFEWFLVGIELAERYFNRNFNELAVTKCSYPLLPDEVDIDDSDELM